MSSTFGLEPPTSTARPSSPFPVVFTRPATPRRAICPQSLLVRLASRPDGVGRYLDLFRTVFPESAGYRHDQLDLRQELDAAQKRVEPTNADSHLTFIGGGLHACVSYSARRSGPVSIHRSRRHARGHAPAAQHDARWVQPRIDRRAGDAGHPGVAASDSDAINLKDPRFGLYDQVAHLLSVHGIEKGRVRLELGASEQAASLTVNETRCC